MFNTEKLQEKWNPVLKHDGLPEIKDNYRKAVTAQLLENQERFMREEKQILTEAPTTQVLSTLESDQHLVTYMVSTQYLLA